MPQVLIRLDVILKGIRVFISFDQDLHSSRVLLHLLDKLIDMRDLIFDLQAFGNHGCHLIFLSLGKYSLVLIFDSYSSVVLEITLARW